MISLIVLVIWKWLSPSSLSISSHSDNNAFKSTPDSTLRASRNLSSLGDRHISYASRTAVRASPFLSNINPCARAASWSVDCRTLFTVRSYCQLHAAKWEKSTRSANRSWSWGQTSRTTQRASLRLAKMLRGWIHESASPVSPVLIWYFEK
jgi:hypothetical protein